MKARKKRGLSPVVATTLLIAMTLALGVIVYLWASNIKGEVISKNGNPVESSCENVFFEAEAYPDRIDIVNRGTIPLYGLEVSKKRLIGELTEIGRFEGGVSIDSGESGSIELQNINENIEINDLLIVYPILLGETENAKEPYACKETGQEVIVK